jgi:Xaa-Pro dipeptidase
VGGVRLEDDIVVTKEGYELLSGLPREIDDVEKILAK